MTLTDNTKKWLTLNAGTGQLPDYTACFVGSGLTYTDGDGVSHSNARTGDVVNAFQTAGELGKENAIIIANTTYTQLKVINDNMDITFPADIQWVYENDGGTGSIATYCTNVCNPPSCSFNIT